MEGIDVCIVGAGPAGLTAGIYTSRSGLSTVIYEKGLPGGLANVTDRIDNFPGFPDGISGLELGERMLKQAERFGVKVVTLTVQRLWREEAGISMSVDSGQVMARSAIVATGSTPKRIGVPGEESLTGKGVSYCATCDGPLYKEKAVAVIGGGDSALQEALFLTRFATKVTVIHRRNEFRAATVLETEVRANPKIELSLNKLIKKIEGTSRTEGVVVEDKASGSEDLIEADGVFIYVGYSPNVEMLGDEFERSETGFLVTGSDLATSVDGVFAAGDVRDKVLRQVVTAAGEGAVAAVSAYAYLESRNNLA
jgi:thioredoxin reductase (NADPH)